MNYFHHRESYLTFSLWLLGLTVPVPSVVMSRLNMQPLLKDDIRACMTRFFFSPAFWPFVSLGVERGAFPFRFLFPFFFLLLLYSISIIRVKCIYIYILPILEPSTVCIHR